MTPPRLLDNWRWTTARLILIYGAFFVLWSVVLLGLIYWQTAHYLGQQQNELLTQQAKYFAELPSDARRAALDDYVALETRHLNAYGLFADDGRTLGGTLAHIPDGVEVDGRVAVLPRLAHSDRPQTAGRPRATRAIARRVPSGEVLVISRDTDILDGVNAIILYALGFGLSLTIVPGVLGGIALGRGPWRRIRAIERAVDPIVRGNLDQRLPVSPRGDELDMLAGIVNSMLAEIERLMGEVKGVSDSIAHDLRTPLTRLRTQLHRAVQQESGAVACRPLIESCLVDVDDLLDRFRALLRVSELEDLHRRAGFADTDLVDALRQVQELYAPLAEDKGVTLALDVATLAPIHADRHLLVEAFSNLVSNAIKFTPAGGRVTMRARGEREGPRVDVLDSGPGIAPAERDAVLQRFYRSGGGRDTPGYGLGLSIVAAIVRLHGFRFEIGDAESGARVTVYCWRDVIAGAVA